MTYHVAGIGEEYIAISGTSEGCAIRVDKNGIEEHIDIGEELICVEHRSWNMFDEEDREYYCPLCL